MINEYYGNEYKQHFTTEVKKRNFTLDFILCKECENYFSNLENIIKPIITTIDEKHKMLKFNEIEYIELQNINSNIVKLYFYSIIWRLHMDFIENGSFAPN
jgi:hypothetical protein